MDPFVLIIACIALLACINFGLAAIVHKLAKENQDLKARLEQEGKA